MGTSSEHPVVGLDGCASPCASPSELDPAALRARLPEPGARRETADLFRILGDPTRVSILFALLEGGELCVCDLSAVIGVSENVVSQALRLLRASDVVRTRRDGRRIHYRLADAHVRLLLDLSADHIGHRATTAAPSRTERKTAKRPTRADRGAARPDLGTPR